MSPPAHCSTSAVLLPAYCTCSPRCRSPQPLPSGSQGVQTGGGLHPHVPDACGAPPSEHSTCGYTDAWSAEFAVCLGPESLVGLPPPADGTRSAAAPACGFSHELEWRSPCDIDSLRRDQHGPLRAPSVYHPLASSSAKPVST
ncbi:hypothetical protein C8T65DRAFT_744430 [Cerioporus squamosus]|nr:hypothetical protein C8T65DRAFT_744430 [Cerioporus squamosus]